MILKAWKTLMKRARVMKVPVQNLKFNINQSNNIKKLLSINRHTRTSDSKSFTDVCEQCCRFWKNCVALHKLIDYVNHHREDGHRIVYITQSANLANEMRQHWRACSEVQTHKNIVEFLCYADLARIQDETLANYQVIGFNEFVVLILLAK